MSRRPASLLRRTLLIATVVAMVAGVAAVASHRAHAAEAREVNAERLEQAEAAVRSLESTVNERFAQLDIAASFVESSYPLEPERFESYLASYLMKTTVTDLSLGILIAAVGTDEIPQLEAQERRWEPGFAVQGPASDTFGGTQLVLMRTPRGDGPERQFMGANITSAVPKMGISAADLDRQNVWFLTMQEARKVLEVLIGNPESDNQTVQKFFAADLLAVQRLVRAGVPGQSADKLIGWFIVPVRMQQLLRDTGHDADVRVALLDEQTGAEQAVVEIDGAAPSYGVLVDEQIAPQGVPWRVQVHATAPAARTHGYDRGVFLAVTVIGLLAAGAALVAAGLLRRRRMLLHELDITTRQATTDHLTNVHNRYGLEREVDAMLHERGGRRVHLLLLDLDRFKLVNDSQGHAVGDELLRVISTRLRAVVGARGVIARFGGDEFVIASDQLGDDAQALRFADEIHAALAEPVSFEGGDEHHASASIGIASAVAGGGVSSGDLLRDADVAMYRAKRSTTTRSAVFDQSMRHDAVRLLEIEKELRTALRRGEIVPFFQPIFGVDGEIYAFEALVRWMHPDRGLMLPGEFLDVASSAGCLPDLDAQVLRRACEQAAHWNLEQPGRPVQVFVNLAEDVLLAPGFVDEVRATLESTGLPPQLLTLEISEDLVLGRLGGNFAELRLLATLGINLAIDDFGRGRSSLLALADLDMVTVLKLDREFVRKLPTHEPTRTVFGAVRQVAKSLDMRIVGEGVESVDEARSLSTLGIDCVQGYLFGRPMPGGRATELLREAREGEQVVVDLRQL